MTAMRSEFAFINRIRAQAARGSVRGLVCGIGDDAAILAEESGRETLVTTDLLIEDVHFKLEYAPPRLLGHKALAVSLSDIAAMGGEPRFALLSLAIPQSAIRNPRSGEFWEEFFAGYFTLAARFGVALVGGDTSASPDRLVIDSVVIGDCAEGRAVRRSGAQVGDAVFVTGQLGAAAAGLELLRRGERISGRDDNLAQRALRAHLMPQPRVEFGRLVGERGLAHAMMDVSDGLAQDLAHICEESGVAALIDSKAVPAAAETAFVAHNAEASFELAVSGGEDYELLLTARPSAEAELVKAAGECQVPLTRVGEVAARDAVSAVSPLLLRRGGEVGPLMPRGYDHF
jgi:thiamine-monophosphate kinase